MWDWLKRRLGLGGRTILVVRLKEQGFVSGGSIEDRVGEVLAGRKRVLYLARGEDLEVLHVPAR